MFKNYASFTHDFAARFMSDLMGKYSFGHDLFSGKSKDESAPKKRKTGSPAGCPYYKQDPIEDFRDQSLIEVKDIEQLIGLGRQLKACPYYGTRLAIPDAEVGVKCPFL